MGYTSRSLQCLVLWIGCKQQQSQQERRILTIYCCVWSLWGRLVESGWIPSAVGKTICSGLATKDECTVLVQPCSYVMLCIYPRMVFTAAWAVQSITSQTWMAEGHHVRGNLSNSMTLCILRKQRRNWNLQRRGSSLGSSKAEWHSFYCMSSPSWTGHWKHHLEVSSNGGTPSHHRFQYLKRLKGLKTLITWMISGVPSMSGFLLRPF